MRLAVVRFLARAFSQMLPHLAMIVVMLLTFAPQATSVWQCEGLPCGVTPWTCCCNQPDDRQDPYCTEANNHFTRGAHLVEVGPCQLDCHCTVVVQDHAPSVSVAPSYAFASPLLAVVPLPFAPDFQAPLVREVVRPFLPRGPPAQSVYLASTPLRGPPIS